MRHRYPHSARAFLEQKFPLFVAGTLIGSLAIGWISWSVFKRNYVVEEWDSKRARTFQEAQLQAMIENAHNSTWQENLDNAMEAQKRFMLPNRRHSEPAFLKKIEQRSREILQENELRRKEETESRKENHFWK
ncbi:hypothetical protein FisN_7Hu349 [Fistulifera solaris]|jgi:hypothetical protein|uniref:Transmembrane protein n=1 Tax=Fistulifera solaris TaxID=1519565 RepID=A0A1Z5KS01_FISSO|nr:hypothetical protein FisN_7Hu349 [Fistulifera solaris]|eukprot:GAX29059.1 hypothetical protein FisN_7Hu349 [Fistulifera solaris]